MIVSKLYKQQIEINDKISVYIPTVGEVIANQDDYYTLVHALTAMPIDMMVQLDDIGVDFSTINDYELFLLLFAGLKAQDTHLVFGDLDLSKFELAENAQNGTVVLIDTEHDIVIDRAIHGLIANTLRDLHNIEKDNRKPANEEARKYMIKRAREKMNRRRNRREESQLEQLIISLVNTEQFKYDFESVLGLTIYQFNKCVRQVIKKIDYDNRMVGVYTGNISTKDLSQDDLNWLSDNK